MVLFGGREVAVGKGGGAAPPLTRRKVHDFKNAEHVPNQCREPGSKTNTPSRSRATGLYGVSRYYRVPRWRDLSTGEPVSLSSLGLVTDTYAFAYPRVSPSPHQPLPASLRQSYPLDSPGFHDSPRRKGWLSDFTFILI